MAQLQRCEQSTLLLLLSLVTVAGKQKGDQPLISKIAPTPAAAEALQQAGNHGSFDWVLECFSKQPSAVGQAVYSPWFTAASREWRLRVYPGGMTAATVGHVCGECSG